MQLTKEEFEAYTPRLRLVRHTGVIIFWMQQNYFFRGEPEKLRSQLMSITIKNLLLGWFSIASIFINPVVTIANWVRFGQYTKEYQRYITAPDQYVFEAKQRHESGADKAKRRSDRMVMAVCITLLIVAFLVTVGIVFDS